MRVNTIALLLLLLLPHHALASSKQTAEQGAEDGDGKDGRYHTAFRASPGR